MTKHLLTALVLALALTLLAFGSTGTVAQTKGEAKKDASTASGLCVASCTSFKWCRQNWRTQGGTVVPTPLYCREASCPGKC